MLKYGILSIGLLLSLLISGSTASKDCVRCYTLEEALQSKKRVESLVLSDGKPNLEGLERLQSLTDLLINLSEADRFPDEILALQNLEQLVIEGNPHLSIDDIARKLQILPKLNNLYLISFDCPTIPESLLQLTRLMQLGISNSGVREVPTGIARLSKLNYLKLVGNEISTLPKEIGQLQNLQVLNIQYNRIEALPEGIEQLQKLYFVQITGNPLTVEAKEKMKTSKINYIYIENDKGSYQWIEPENDREQK